MSTYCLGDPLRGAVLPSPGAGRGPSRTQIIQQWTCTWWWALEGSRPVGPLETGEVRALAFTALSPLRVLCFVFQVDGEGFENTLDASSLDFKVPPVSYHSGAA